MLLNYKVPGKQKVVVDCDREMLEVVLWDMKKESVLPKDFSVDQLGHTDHMAETLVVVKRYQKMLLTIEDELNYDYSIAA